MCTSRINYTYKNALCRVAHDGGGVRGPASRCQYERNLKTTGTGSTKESLTGRRLYDNLRGRGASNNRLYVRIGCRMPGRR
jgi:hypothetical protein